MIKAQKKKRVNRFEKVREKARKFDTKCEGLSLGRLLKGYRDTRRLETASVSRELSLGGIHKLP